jgi:hypothetical protein
MRPFAASEHDDRDGGEAADLRPEQDPEDPERASLHGP